MNTTNLIEPIIAQSVHIALEAICGKWKPFILLPLLEQDLRYGRLRQAIPAISEKVLIQQLNELRRSGIVVRKAFPNTPPHVEYGLTAYGHTIKPLLVSLSLWGTAHRDHQV